MTESASRNRFAFRLQLLPASAETVHGRLSFFEGMAGVGERDVAGQPCNIGKVPPEIRSPAH